MTEQIAAHAFVALNQEFLTTPKPGLVDKNNQGAHKDMGIRHFFASANALRPFFCRFAETGFLTRDLSPEETFARIRPIGMEAEQEMLRATGGVNTHKGAIFTMGLLCAAAGRLSPDQWQTETLLAQCAAMTKGLVAQDFGGITPENAKTAGERIFAMHGVSGVRGQAEAGFPAIAKAGLPILRQGLSKGLSLNDAGCITLLHLLAETDDTNLIHRSDYQTQQQIRRDVTALLEKDPFPSLSVIEELDRDFIQRNLSPGGSADLLAATFFLYFLERSGNP
jgi:holo-ACP synthase/triphosphoribosyl-dephospho-CoA synthase